MQCMQHAQDGLTDLWNWPSQFDALSFSDASGLWYKVCTAWTIFSTGGAASIIKQKSTKTVLAIRWMDSDENWKRPVVVGMGVSIYHTHKLSEEIPFSMISATQSSHWTSHWLLMIITGGGGGGGHSTLGYAPCATKKTLLFSLAFTERPPFLPTFTLWPLFFDKLLSPCHRKTLILAHFNSQTSDNFPQKNWIFGKFRQIWRNVEKPLAILVLKTPIFRCISLKDPLCTLSLKDILFLRNVSPKDPYIWCAWWHSYVTFMMWVPPPGLLIIVGCEESIFVRFWS